MKNIYKKKNYRPIEFEPIPKHRLIFKIYYVNYQIKIYEFKYFSSNYN